MAALSGIKVYANVDADVKLRLRWMRALRVEVNVNSDRSVINLRFFLFLFSFFFFSPGKRALLREVAGESIPISLLAPIRRIRRLGKIES